MPVSGLRARIARGQKFTRAVAVKVVKVLDSSGSDLSNASGRTGTSRAARAIAKHAVAGAAASAHNATTMATVVAAMDAEFGMLLDAANQARQEAQALLEQAARCAQAARRRALVGRIDKTQEEP